MWGAGGGSALLAPRKWNLIPTWISQDLNLFHRNNCGNHFRSWDEKAIYLFSPFLLPPKLHPICCADDAEIEFSFVVAAAASLFQYFFIIPALGRQQLRQKSPNIIDDGSPRRSPLERSTRFLPRGIVAIFGRRKWTFLITRAIILFRRLFFVRRRIFDVAVAVAVPPPPLAK